MNDILLGIRVAKLEEKVKELERLLEMRCKNCHLKLESEVADNG